MLFCCLQIVVCFVGGVGVSLAKYVCDQGNRDLRDGLFIFTFLKSIRGIDFRCAEGLNITDNMMRF
jgi:hypothetical protein